MKNFRYKIHILLALFALSVIVAIVLGFRMVLMPVHVDYNEHVKKDLRGEILFSHSDTPVNAYVMRALMQLDKEAIKRVIDSKTSPFLDCSPAKYKCTDGWIPADQADIPTLQRDDLSEDLKKTATQPYVCQVQTEITDKPNTRAVCVSRFDGRLGYFVQIW